MSRREDFYYLDKLGKVYRAFRSMYPHPRFSDKLRIQCELYMAKMMLTGLNEHMGFPIPDLMWINPNWIENFSKGSKIVLYGAGRLGKVYYRQILSDSPRRLLLSCWVDQNYRKLTEYPQEIQSPECIRTVDYDYILLALADKQPALEIRRQLIADYQVDADKIIWLEPQEILWEYARAAGLLKG